MQFTIEIEEHIPFLECLVIRDNNKTRATVYRKKTHTERLRDLSSYNPTSHKDTTNKTLTRRAQLVCDSPDSLSDETRHLERVRKTTISPTLSNLTLTKTLNLTRQPTTPPLSQQRLYLTSNVLLRL